MAAVPTGSRWPFPFPLVPTIGRYRRRLCGLCSRVGITASLAGDPETMRGGWQPAPPVDRARSKLHVPEFVPSLGEDLGPSLDLLVARVIPVGLEILDDELGLRDELLPVVRLVISRSASDFPRT